MQWQTLFGAVLGGLFALLVALLVAYKARRHEDRIAAMLVFSNLVRIRQSAQNLIKIAEERELPEDALPFWYAEKISRHRLMLSPTFEGYRVRLIALDMILAVHLETFQLLYSGVEQKLDKLAEDIDAYDSTSATKRNHDIVQADAKAIYGNLGSS